MNDLDLTKIAKAFGFKVPPRFDLSIGPGRRISSESRTGEKRRREEDEEESDGERGDSGQTSVRELMRKKERDGKARRIF